MNAKIKRIDANDPRLAAGSFVLALGSLLCFFDFVYACFAQTVSDHYISLATGLIMLSLILLLRKTRAAEAVFAIAVLSATICNMTPFLLTGNILYLSCGVCIPIGATIFGGARLGLAAGIFFTLVGMTSAIALQQQWITPMYPINHISRGVLIDSCVVILIMLSTWVAAIWLEINFQRLDIQRSQSDFSRQKQLKGLHLLAEAAEILLATKIPETYWKELLTNFADHLDCGLFLSYELLRERLYLRADSGLPKELKSKYEVIGLGENICGLCAKSRSLILLNGSELEEHAQGAELAKLGVKSAIAIPLIYENQLVGTLSFASTSKVNFSSEEIDLVKMFCQLIATVRGRSIANSIRDEALTRLEKIASRVPGIVCQFRLRPDGTFCFPYASARMLEIHGVHPEEVVDDGSKVYAFHHPDDVEPLMASIYKSAKDLSPWMHDFRLKFPDGSVKWISGNSIPEREPDGSTLFHGYIADVTERIQTQQCLSAALSAAESANRAKSEFLANMSHEIRTPMTAILGYADILASNDETDLSSPSKTECIETIKRNGQHLMSIINDILDISKIEADKLLTERIDVSPLQIAFEVMELMKIKANAKGLMLKLVTESPIPKIIQSDPTRLRQILVNLVGNAIKFTKSGNVFVTVRVEASNTSLICFDVTDTGIGLSEAQVQKLFKPFEQADSSTTRKFGGTGLGLQISKRLAVILGGDIFVSSELGSGSIFSLRIATSPRGEGSATRDSEQAVETTTNQFLQSQMDFSDVEKHESLNGVRILLVEDSPDNQRLITHHLVKEGASVHISDNGKLAVERLCENELIDGELRLPSPYDLILMDMQMPEMDGYQATQLLRSKGFQFPILALTAHAMDVDQIKCLQVGCDARLTKPINKSDLVHACQEWSSKAKQISPVSS